MPEIPEAYHDLFEKATIAHLTTMLPDGRPHTTPVGIDYDADADRLLVNTERHTRKARNVERDPTVSASMTDPDDPNRFLSVTGEVETVTTEGAPDHVDELAGRYMGDEEYSEPTESERILFHIRPEDIYSMA